MLPAQAALQPSVSIHHSTHTQTLTHTYIALGSPTHPAGWRVRFDSALDPFAVFWRSWNAPIARGPAHNQTQHRKRATGVPFSRPALLTTTRDYHATGCACMCVCVLLLMLLLWWIDPILFTTKLGASLPEKRDGWWKFTFILFSFCTQGSGPAVAPAGQAEQTERGLARLARRWRNSFCFIYF